MGHYLKLTAGADGFSSLREDRRPLVPCPSKEEGVGCRVLDGFGFRNLCEQWGGCLGVVGGLVGGNSVHFPAGGILYIFLCFPDP